MAEEERRGSKEMSAARAYVHDLSSRGTSMPALFVAFFCSVGTAAEDAMVHKGTRGGVLAAQCPHVRSRITGWREDGFRPCM